MTKTRQPKSRYTHRLLARLADEEHELPTPPRRIALRYRPPRRARPAPPYGFGVASGNRLVPEPAEQAVIAEIVSCWRVGWLPAAIAAELERDGSTMRGQRWRASAVTQILRRVLIGERQRWEAAA